ncbi:MAG TPA: host attachment family protein, partial [Steroidobacteraceae bacterium]|nr:host attachment family protein [Steroidobacteraceae bacterium]
MQKPSIPHDALVLVGDGARAIFFRNKGTVQRPALVTERILEQQNPATREQGTDRPGRRAGGDSESVRGAIEPTDWHQLAEDRFASDIAGALYQQAHANRFQ